LDEWPGSFSEAAFTSDYSALFAFEQAFQHLYRLELPDAPTPVYTLPGDLRRGTLPAGLIPRKDGDMLLYFSRSDDAVTFVVFDREGSVTGAFMLNVPSCAITASGDGTLISMAPRIDEALPSVPTFPSRSVQDEMAPVTFTFIDTLTWSIGRTATVSLPKNGGQDAGLFASPGLT